MLENNKILNCYALKIEHVLLFSGHKSENGVSVLCACHRKQWFCTLYMKEKAE